MSEEAEDIPIEEKPIEDQTVTELEATRGRLRAKHGELRKQIIDLLHDQGRVENDLSLAEMLIAKAYRKRK